LRGGKVDAPLASVEVSRALATHLARSPARPLARLTDIYAPGRVSREKARLTPPPFGLSLSKPSLPLPQSQEEERGAFDKLRPNGGRWLND
jgi:hypothetical protein